MKTQETVQNRQAELVKELSGKIDGFSDALLKELSLQDLQTLADNMAIVNKETGSKTRSNVATEVLNHFIENKIESLPSTEVYDLVRVANILNYFELKEGNELPTTREALNAFILLKRLNSNNDKTNSERQADWLKRGKAYTESHIIGIKNSGSLFKNKNATHYFVETNGTISLTSKDVK